MGNQVEQGFLSPFLQRARIAAARPYLNGQILDIGCGNGALAAFVGPDLYLGMDRDKKALAAARASFPKHQFVEKLPAKGPFDTVVALALIEHLKEPQSELKLWSSLLSEGGRILLTTPCRSFRSVHEFGSRAGVFSRDAAREHVEMFNRRSLTALAERAGMRLIYYYRFLAAANQLAVFVKRN
jgi:2-polyprenyl-3-methyl-5-hydroxy-6-metoxy-1,4-benzoquinol methylase